MIDESTDGGGEEGHAQPFVPDHEWLDALDAQLTDDVIDRVRNFARLRAFGVGCTGRKVDDYYARELVQDAIADTFTGVLRWDPQRVDLAGHLMRAVQSRTRHDTHREQAFPHVALGDANQRSVEAEHEASGLAGPSPARNSRSAFADEIMEQLRAAASNDRDVLRILDAFDANATTKAEVMAFAKMKARTYHNARIRMARIVRNMSNKHGRPAARGDAA